MQAKELRSNPRYLLTPMPTPKDKVSKHNQNKEHLQVCSRCRHNFYLQHPAEKENWEIEFDKKFPVGEKWVTCSIKDCGEEMCGRVSMKSFIRKAIHAGRENEKKNCHRE